MHGHDGQDRHITLTQAAKITPGRPSTNCLWRWCRRGVLGRNGERIRLQHVRMGGKIYTTPRWVRAFGRALAEADHSYFDSNEQARQADRPRVTDRAMTRETQNRRGAHEEANRELEEAGL